jgi:UTP--glucose-1-phosphate uridylyltransferase
MSEQTRTLDTAIIPVAGLGTRMFPFSMTCPKFMVPVPVVKTGEMKPNIDFTLDECLAAGIRNFIFVYSRDGKDILQRHLGPLSGDDAAAMKDLGKLKQLQAEQSRREAFSAANGVSIEYIEQRLASGKYGTTVPVSLAAEKSELLKSAENFAIYGGDNFVFRADGKSELDEMRKAWIVSGDEHALAGTPIDRKIAATAGGILLSENGRFTGIGEHLPLDQIPEYPVWNAANYILNRSILSYVDADISSPLRAGQNEFRFTDVVNAAVNDGHSFYVHEVGGEYMDVGMPDAFLNSAMHLNGIDMYAKVD